MYTIYIIYRLEGAHEPDGDLSEQRRQEGGVGGAGLEQRAVAEDEDAWSTRSVVRRCGTPHRQRRGLHTAACGVCVLCVRARALCLRVGRHR